MDVVLKKLTHENMTMLTYRRHAVQSLITHANSPKVRRPISNITFLDSQNVPKRHKSSYSVHKSIRLENLGCHWMIYLVEGEDVTFAAKTNSSQDHIINALTVVFFMLQ